MIRKWAAYKRGAVRIRMEGQYPERFINCCIAGHIYLWDVKKFDGCVYAWIALPDFFRIRPAARKSGVRVTVERRYGFPFLFRQWKKRKVLLAGACGFFAALYWLSGFVWFLEIKGAPAVLAEHVERVAEEKGLYVGARLESVSGRAVEKQLLMELPGIAWVGVSFTGTKAVVEIVEKVAPPTKASAAGNLVAAKAGVITECISILGEKVVQVGDVVREGDLLIRAVPVRLSGDREQGTQADGIVKAKISYESLGEAPLRRAIYTPTKERAYAVRVNWDGEAAILWDADLSGFPAYETEHIVKKIPWWRNSEPVVELDINTYCELNVSFEENSAEEAKNAAVLDALSKSRNLIPEDASVLERNVELVESDDSNLIKIKLRLATEEEIGKHIRYSGE